MREAILVGKPKGRVECSFRGKDQRIKRADAPKYASRMISRNALFPPPSCKLALDLASDLPEQHRVALTGQIAQRSRNKRAAIRRF